MKLFFIYDKHNRHYLKTTRIEHYKREWSKTEGDPFVSKDLAERIIDQITPSLNYEHHMFNTVPHLIVVEKEVDL